MAKRFVKYIVPDEDRELPPLKRPAFRRLLNRLKKQLRGCGMIVSSPLDLSRTEEGFEVAMKRLKLNLIEVMFATDPLAEELESVRNDERIKRMLEEVQADGTKVEFFPASYCPQYEQKTLSSALALHKTVSVYLAARAPILNDAAHELAHRLLELEGYPTGRPVVEDKEVSERIDKFGPTYSSVYSSIVDIEVDKRLVKYGFDPREATDQDARKQIEQMKKDPAPEYQEEIEVLMAALHGPYRYCWLSGELKAEYFDLLKRDAPAYDLAMEIIGIIEKNGGTDKPESVKRILDEMESILERFGIEPLPFRSCV